ARPMPGGWKPSPTGCARPLNPSGAGPSSPFTMPSRTWPATWTCTWPPP
ncbi:MAG: hypothetical protein AMXMBFR83_12640, partial [Phycisphaerae bacterium]